MANFKTQLIGLWDEFENEAKSEFYLISDFSDWAIRNKRWQPRPHDVRKILDREISEALRQAKRIDKFGIEYRSKICIRDRSTGIQLTLWADADNATQRFVEKSVSQRRRSIVGECHQLKSDVDHFNLIRQPEAPIQLDLNFTDDVAEIQAVERARNKKKSA